MTRRATAAEQAIEDIFNKITDPKTTHEDVQQGLIVRGFDISPLQEYCIDTTYLIFLSLVRREEALHLSRAPTAEPHSPAMLMYSRIMLALNGRTPEEVSADEILGEVKRRFGGNWEGQLSTGTADDLLSFFASEITQEEWDMYECDEGVIEPTQPSFADADAPAEIVP